jgi:hypothetical protein
MLVSVLLGLRVGLVVSRNLLAEGVTLIGSALGRLDTPDAAPAFAILGQYLAHLFDRVMGGTVVAESSFGHQFFLSGSGALLGMVGLFVRPRDSEQPAASVAT